MCVCVSVSRAWWGGVLIGPLEEAALLLPGLPAGVEGAALVGPVLLHRARHRRLVAVAHGRSAVPRRAPLGPGGLGRLVVGRPPALQHPLLAGLVGPQEEAAVAAVALVELAALVGAVLTHGQQQRVLPAVTHDGVAAAATVAP